MSIEVNQAEQIRRMWNRFIELRSSATQVESAQS